MRPELSRAFSSSLAGLVAPDVKTLSEEMEREALGKLPAFVKSYRVEVFDMSSADERKRYEATMMDVFAGIRAKRAVIWRNELQVLPKADGSSSWHRYLEWSEYDVAPNDFEKDVK